MNLFKLRVFWFFCLVFIVVSVGVMAATQDINESNDWSVNKAIDIHNMAVQKKQKSLLLSKSVNEIRQKNQEFIKIQTGFGETPHAPDGGNIFDQKENQPNVLELYQNFLQKNKLTAKSLSPLSVDFLNQFVVKNKAAVSVTNTINNYNATPVANGGYVFVYETTTHNYLGSSSINASGEITYSATLGQQIDVVFIPYSGTVESIQVLENIIVAQNMTLSLERAYAYTANLVNENAQALSSLSGTVKPVLTAFYSFSGSSTQIVNGTAVVYLTATASYNIKVSPDVPYLINETPSNNIASDSSADIVIAKGLLLDIDFNDLNGLVGIGGCVLSGSVTVRRSFDNKNISNYQDKLDGSNNLIGFLVTVLDTEAVDMTLKFSDSNVNFCKIQDIQLDRHWFAAVSHTITVDLLARPVPNFIFQDKNAAALTYSSGRVYQLSNGKSNYLSPTSLPSLIAGENYAVNLTASGYSVNETIFTAQEGNFDVVVTSDVLTTIKSDVTMGSAYRINALIELSQAGDLVQAYEFRGRELTIEVPVGTYDVRVSGITAENGTQFIVLKPFDTSKTFTGTGSERMDFNLTIPSTGIQFTIPNQDINLHLTFFDGMLPVASKFLYPGYSDRLLTDFSTLKFNVRSSGFPDTQITAIPSAGLPTVDILASQGAVGRLSGIVSDSNGQPLEGVSVLMYFENGIASSVVDRTDVNGMYDIPKLKNGLVQFLTPDNGDSTQQQYAILNPASNTTFNITLPDLPFNSTVHNSTDLQLFYGTGQRGFQIVVLAESYTNITETFTDSNSNGVWDGILFLDYNNNGVWDYGSGNYEPIKAYGDKTIDYSNGSGTNVSSSNEAFVDSNSDGYPNINDYAVFIQNAKNYIRALLGVPFIEQNIEFDAYILFVPSNQAGQDIIDASDVTIVSRDTQFSAQVTLARNLLGINYDLARQTLDVVAPDRDLTVVMINQPVFVGRANSFILANGGIGNSRPNSATPGHEFGHNPGRLGDEYNEFDGTSINYFPPGSHMNHSTDSNSVGWYPDIGGRFDLPVSVPFSFDVGVYAGGSLNAGGAYRSTTNSRMRYNAPEYNAASKTILNRSFCLSGLTQSDFVGVPNVQVQDPNVLYADGFEDVQLTSGIITDPCQSP